MTTKVTMFDKVAMMSEKREDIYAKKLRLLNLDVCLDKDGNELPENIRKVAQEYADTRLKLEELELRRRELEENFVKALLEHNLTVTDDNQLIKSAKFPEKKRQIILSKSEKIEYDEKELIQVAEKNNLLTNVQEEVLRPKAIDLAWVKANVAKDKWPEVMDLAFSLDKFLNLVDAKIIPEEDLVVEDPDTQKLRVMVTPVVKYGVMFKELKETKAKDKK